MVTVNFNLDEVLSPARLGVRRAAAFVGFAWQSSEQHSVTELEVPGEIGIKFFDKPKPEFIEEVRGEFRQWVYTNAIRELIERFAMTLDWLYPFVLTFPRQGRLDPEEDRAAIKKFGHGGVGGKLDRLVDAGYDAAYVPHFRSMVIVRNCLTHGGGIVTEKYVTEAGALVFTWRRLQLGLAPVAGGPSQPLKVGMYVEAGSHIMIKFEPTQRSFPIGTTIKLEPNDVLEACLMVNAATDLLQNNSVALASKHGIPFQASVKAVPGSVAG